MPDNVAQMNAIKETKEPNCLKSLCCAQRNHPQMVIAGRPKQTQIPNRTPRSELIDLSMLFMGSTQQGVYEGSGEKADPSLTTPKLKNTLGAPCTQDDTCVF
jgi:hypothetical protein